MAEFTTQKLETTDKGENVLGFIIKKNDFDALKSYVNSMTGGDHLFAVKEEGEQLKVSLFVFSNEPTFIHKLKNDVNSFINDELNVVIPREASSEPNFELEIDI